MIPHRNEEGGPPVLRHRPPAATPDQELATQIKALAVEEAEYKRSGDKDREGQVRGELARLRGLLRAGAAPPNQRAQKREAVR